MPISFIFLHLKIIKLLWLDVPFLSVFFFFFCIFIEGPISATGPRQKRKRWKLYLPYLVFPILPCMTNWLTSLYDKLVLISFFFCSLIHALNTSWILCILFSSSPIKSHLHIFDLAGKKVWITLVFCCYFSWAEIKEMLSIALRDLRFSSAVVHQVRDFFFTCWYLIILFHH